MQTDIIIAGFGGQGVLFAGQLLAYAAMDEGREVTWIPSYGPEMRGGTANCTVVIADEEIGSPLVRNPQAVIAMNLPSLDKYEPAVRADGVMIINSSIINRGVTRTDIRALGGMGDNRRIDHQHPTRLDGRLVLIQRRQVHGNHRLRVAHQWRTNLFVGDHHRAIGRPTAHLGAVGGDPGHFAALIHGGVGQQLPSEQDALPAKTGNDNIRLHVSSALDLDLSDRRRDLVIAQRVE